jgi:hypothetical protein
MRFPTVLVATWTDGLFVLSGERHRQELSGRPVRGLAPDGQGSVLAIVDGHSLCRRRFDVDGEWIPIATSALQLACAVVAGDAIYVGSEDDAHVLRVEANGEVHRLQSFDRVAGRETWYAGSALVSGQVIGPPLGVRSMTATSDGSVLLANVHVGGIPRSTDGGITWQPTIDVGSDMHEVRAHPHRPRIVIAAAAKGLCVSRDGGATWTVERTGLHADYCAAVAFSGDDLLVSASADHFATQSAVYRRAIDGQEPLEPICMGLPRWFDGIIDTSCIATSRDAVAIADKGGNVYLSTDAGRAWSRIADGLPSASSVLII